MAILKCKMCGGDMELAPDKTFGTCEYCGSTMTLPKIEEEQLAAAFNRGNHFRRSGEFDKALSVYERIVEQDDSNAEAHWCCALCRFGIEYVEDPTTYEWLPTCHRASFDSFFEDVDYLAALEHSDGITRRQYQKDGAKIAEVQRGILATSRNAEPYDVFISYKELDENKNRTRDSILAQEIYYQLTEQGRRVFFSRISLEDIPGTEYEPYIFAALNSAKVMIVVGTSGENLNAVWVKNEWSRFLSMMRKDRSKLLLPCYRDMDPYDLPEQLSVLMSYDMGKIGFIQDLIRGVNKVLDADKPRETVKETVKETVVVRSEGGSSGSNVTALLKRGNMALEDRAWERAAEFYEQVLNQDAECGAAYWGLFLQEQRASSPADFLAQQKRAFADARTETLTACEEDSGRIQAAVEKYTVKAYLAAEQIRELFPFDRSYKSKLSERKKQKEQCLAPLRQNKNLQRAAQYGEEALKEQVQKLQTEITALLDENIAKAKKADENSIANIQKAYAAHLNKAEAQAKQLQEEALAKQEADYRAAAVRARKLKKLVRLTAMITAAAFGVYLLLTLVILPSIAYKEAEALFAEGEYEAAVTSFEKAGTYKDAADRIPEVYYVYADALLSNGNVAEAETMFAKAGDYKDASARMPEDSNKQSEEQQAYNDAQRLHALGKYTAAAEAFQKLGDYEDASTWAEYCLAEHLVTENKKAAAAMAFHRIGDFLDAPARADRLWFESGVRKMIAASDHTVAVRADGTVLATGAHSKGQCEVEDWTDIVAVAAGRHHTVGLRADGTLVATEAVRSDGYYSGQCEVEDWTNIVAIAASDSHTLGLCSDGTVKVTPFYVKEPITSGTGPQHQVEDWTDIIAIAAGAGLSVGLRSDGTIVMAGEKSYGREKAETWTDIVAIDAGFRNVQGIHSNGSVEIVGQNASHVNESWIDIYSLSVGGTTLRLNESTPNLFTLGLRKDGTVIAGGDNSFGQCQVSEWTDIVAICTGRVHAVGLRADGRLEVSGLPEKNLHNYGQCNVSDWTNIRVPQKISG